MDTSVTSAKAHIESLTGHSFTNNALLREALDAAGFSKRYGNKPLAHVGDSVLNTAIARDWWATPNGGKSGDKLRQTITNNKNLANVGRATGLVDHIFVHPGQRYKVEVDDRVVADSVEAVLGAIYIDSGDDLNTVKAAIAGFGLTAANAIAT